MYLINLSSAKSLTKDEKQVYQDLDTPVLAISGVFLPSETLIQVYQDLDTPVSTFIPHHP